jgi:hypothetical protein
MAIRKVPEIPEDLPHSRIYLEDVEQIVSVIGDALKRTTPVDSLSPQDQSVTFSIDDTRLDSITDLEELGGTTTTFQLRVKQGGRSCVLRLYSFLKPKLETYSLPENEQWVVYGNVKAIFARRQFRIKNSIDALPEWLKVTLWGLLIFLPQLVFWPANRRWNIGIAIGIVALFALIGFTLFRPSRVLFVRSHERAKVVAVARRSYVRDVLFLILGAGISKLFERC